MVNIGWKKPTTGDNPWDGTSRSSSRWLRTQTKKEREANQILHQNMIWSNAYIPTLELEFRSFFIATTKSSQGTFWCANT